ncbi:hypothetical protein LTR56_003425 [Elasticomyces elasticus]|nr:hypothetical protein LTR22_026256 [Elasticomyces elasticus]KAK3655776.1 hypothetical protein LTR56_003425 [Elasticomyces elasticus]KAK4931371.1 hypothetical protein LTR49_002072 [Elasticomyces elasticus]KAK5766110.1 hypothetical protein LTS12_003856 [Elasticomyces elasticus]
MYMPNNATALADYPSTTITVLTETAVFIIGLSQYLIFISGGFAVSLASSWYTARALIRLCKSRHNPQQASSEEWISAEVEQAVNIEITVIIVTVASYILALVASFVRHWDDGEHWPGVFLITSGCVIGVLVGHLLCVLTVGLASGAWSIFNWLDSSHGNLDGFGVPEVRRGRRKSTGVMKKCNGMRKYDV